MDDSMNKTVCPLCGSREYIKPNLDEDIKDAFLESILAGCPFTRKYDLMAGKLKITVAALSDESNRLRAEFLMKLSEKLDPVPEIKAYIPLLEQAMDIDSQILNVTVITDKGSKSFDRTPNDGIKQVLMMPWDELNTDTCHDFASDMISRFNSSILTGTNVPAIILRGSVAKHNSIVNMLIKECLDENFLDGTGQ